MDKGDSSEITRNPPVRGNATDRLLYFHHVRPSAPRSFSREFRSLANPLANVLDGIERPDSLPNSPNAVDPLGLLNLAPGVRSLGRDHVAGDHFLARIRLVT